MAKLLKTRRKPIQTQKSVSDMDNKAFSVILVGTYKKNQLAFIEHEGVYNYPIDENDKLKSEDAICVKELWLYADRTKVTRHVFDASFIGIQTREEFLAAHPKYPKGSKCKHTRYLVFTAKKLDYGSAIDGATRVFARASDFNRGKTREIAAAIKRFEADGDFASLADYLPKDLAEVPRRQLRVCESAVQLDFFDELMPSVVNAVANIAEPGKKLRLATVFSGIGAIEQALMRTHIDHEIVFACDNGDQSPFVCSAVTWDELVSTFWTLNADVEALQPQTESQCWSADMIRKQRDTIQALLNGAPAMSKRPDRELKDRVNMLYESIGFFNFRVQWEGETDWKERKHLVDMLYRPLLSRNKVRQSYMANYPVSDERFHWNVSFLEGLSYRNEVDLFVGGSPCQSFSLVGKQMGLSDTRGTLFYEYARLVSEIRPKCFIYENVRALLSNDSGRTWKTMAKVFSDLGYDWKHQVLNSKDYGIPQNRERVFVVGFRKDLKVGDRFEFPKPKKLETTMQDYLLDTVAGKYYLPEKGVRFVLDEGNLTKRYTQVDGTVQLCQKKNQQFNWHGDFVFVGEDTANSLGMPEMEKYFLSEKVTKYVLASGTKTFYTRPKTDLEIARPLLTSMHKMHRAGIDNYITRQGRIRKLAPRECLRLMGFSDTFKIVVPDTPMYQQAGNAIVVDVLVSILDSIKQVIPNFLTVKEV